MPLANPEAFHAWTLWRDGSAGVVSVFLTSYEKGVMATKSHTHLLANNLNVKALDVVLKWARPPPTQ